MNTKQLHSEPKRRGSADVTYLGRTVDEMILRFMKESMGILPKGYMFGAAGGSKSVAAGRISAGRNEKEYSRFCYFMGASGPQMSLRCRPDAETAERRTGRRRPQGDAAAGTSGSAFFDEN